MQASIAWVVDSITIAMHVTPMCIITAALRMYVCHSIHYVFIHVAIHCHLSTYVYIKFSLFIYMMHKLYVYRAITMTDFMVHIACWIQTQGCTSIG